MTSDNHIKDYSLISDRSEVQRMLDDIVNHSVEYACIRQEHSCLTIGWIASLQEPLWPVEENAISSGVEKRRREFTAGRTAARMSLRALNCGEHPIPVGPRRNPVFPTGFSGSLTHGADLAGALIIQSHDSVGVGLDIEHLGAVDSSLFDTVMNAAERKTSSKLSISEQRIFPTLVFCAKEAIYKCIDLDLQPHTDFANTTIYFGHRCLTFRGAVRPLFSRFSGHHFCFDGEVFSAGAVALAVAWPSSSRRGHDCRRQ